MSDEKDIGKEVDSILGTAKSRYDSANEIKKVQDRIDDVLIRGQGAATPAEKQTLYEKHKQLGDIAMSKLGGISVGEARSEREHQEVKNRYAAEVQYGGFWRRFRARGEGLTREERRKIKQQAKRERRYDR